MVLTGSADFESFPKSSSNSSKLRACSTSVIWGSSDLNYQDNVHATTFCVHHIVIISSKVAEFLLIKEFQLQIFSLFSDAYHVAIGYVY